MSVIFVKTENLITKEITTHAIIDRGNGEYTSMPKAVYDAQVEQLTENVPVNE